MTELVGAESPRGSTRPRPAAIVFEQTRGPLLVVRVGRLSTKTISLGAYCPACGAFFVPVLCPRSFGGQDGGSAVKQPGGGLPCADLRSPIGVN